MKCSFHNVSSVNYTLCLEWLCGEHNRVLIAGCMQEKGTVGVDV